MTYAKTRRGLVKVAPLFAQINLIIEFVQVAIFSINFRVDSLLLLRQIDTRMTVLCILAINLQRDRVEFAALSPNVRKPIAYFCAKEESSLPLRHKKLAQCQAIYLVGFAENAIQKIAYRLVVPKPTIKQIGTKFEILNSHLTQADPSRPANSQGPCRQRSKRLPCKVAPGD